MLSPHLRKFSDLYAAYGLGSVKNIWLITCLIPLARTANLNKMKDYIGAVLPKTVRSRPATTKGWFGVFRTGAPKMYC